MESFLDPDKILNEIELRNDMIAAEFGCGAGTISLALAKKIREGKVYGLDVQEEPLSALMGRAKQERISNIETIRCNLEKEGGSTLPDSFLDLVLFPNVLFQAEDRMAMFKEGVRILKKEGRALIIDWKKDSPLGPKEKGISITEVKNMAEGLGLSLEKEFSAGTFHYGLIFKKV